MTSTAVATLLVLAMASTPLTAGANEPRTGSHQAAACAKGFATAPSVAAFRPSTHGFAFVNSFRGSPLPISLGNFERRLNIPDRFGLCGGMCFAAADYFLAGRSIADEIPQNEPPENGSPLYQYLYARQTASLGPMAVMFTKFLEWMDLPEGGADGTHARTNQELPAILAAIEAGKPVMLGLVLVDGRDTREVWRNHQILVYSTIAIDEALGAREAHETHETHEANEADTTPTFRIYDPNYPHRDDAILRWTTDDDDPRWERHIPGARRQTTRIRGFFRMDYLPVEPPHAHDDKDEQ